MKLRPTKGLIGLAVVLLLSLAPAALDNGPVGWLPFLTVLFCVVLSLIHLMLVKDQVHCMALPEQESLVRGDEIPFRAEVENNSFLPVPNLSVQFFLSGTSGQDQHIYPMQMTLSSRERRSFSINAVFTHIGVYEAGLRQVVISDLFGVFQAEGRAEDRRRLDIQPRLLDIRQLPVSDRQAAENDRTRTVSPLSGMDYVGVRDYAYGDPIKTIQWKLSAHAGGLMTKQTESYTNSGAAIVLDFAVPDYDRETRLELADGIAETGAAAGDWCVRSGMDYFLLLPGENGGFRRCTPASFRDLRSWLPYMTLREPDSTGRLARALRRECSGGHSQNNILLCTSDLTEDTLAALLQLKHNQKNPSLFLLLPVGVDSARRRAVMARMAQLQYAGISCRIGKDAEEVTA